MVESTQRTDRIVWADAKAGEIGHMVVRVYDLASRHLFKANLRWQGTWAVSKSPLAMRNGGPRVDEGLSAAIEAAAPAIFGRHREALVAAWSIRMGRMETHRSEAERRAEQERIALDRKRRVLLDAACRFEWEARRGMRRMSFPIERTVSVRLGKERRKLVCLLDPRAVALTLRVEGAEEAMTFDAFGIATGSGIAPDEARRLIRSTVRRAFESQPSFFQGLDLAWQAEECLIRIDSIGFEAAASAGGLLEARIALDECVALAFHPGGLASGEGIAWSQTSALDGDTLRVVAHDLDRACQVDAIVSRSDGRWRATVMDVRRFDGDGTPIRSDDTELAETIEAIAERQASEHAEDFERARNDLDRRRELKRKVSELEAWGRIERMRETEAEMIAKVRELMAEALKGGRPPTEFPASWFFPGSHVELRVEASGATPQVSVSVERPVEFGFEGGVEELYPAILFTLEGDLQSENADWHRLAGAGQGWNLWATHMRRDAIAAVAKLVVHPMVGLEIEAFLLAREAKALQVQRHALKSEWGLAESAA